MAVRAGLANLSTVGQSTAKFIPGSLVLHDRHTDSYGANTTRLVRDTGTTEDGNRRTWTWSGWIKKDAHLTSVYQVFFSNGANSSGEGFIGFNGDDKLYFGNDGHHNFVTTNYVFSDNGWYHIVWAADTEQSSASNRWKIYVNGELIPASEYASPGVTHYGEGYIQAYGQYGMDISVGDRERGHRQSGNAAWPVSGNICEVLFIDGEQLPAERFGYKDPLTGNWRPKKFIPTATPNDGGTWSTNSDSPIDANFFDGCSTEAGTGKVLVVGSDTNWKTITDKPFTIHKSLELITSDGYHVRARLNGASGDIVATGNHADGSTFGHVPNTGTFPFDISSLTLPYTVNSMEYIYGNGSGSMYVHGIKVDGVTLIDGNTSNIGKHGFHLPLDGTKPIGEDQSGNGNDFTSYNLGNLSTLEHATGAAPILNTIDEGAVAVPGVRGSKLNEEYAVTTASNKFVIDGVSQKSLTGLVRGATYTFDQSDSSNASHPLRLAPIDKHTNTYWYSVDFDGTGDYLSIDTTGTELNFGTGEFTIEGWFYFDSSATPNNGLFQICGDTGGLSASANTLSINLETSGGRTYQLYGASTGGWRTGGKDHEFLPFKWHHVAMVRSSGTITIYINGRPSQSWSDTTTYNYDAAAVGGYYTTGYLWNGYISNFRIVKGTALYTSEFTPSAVPLTNVSGTELLCCQESTVTNAVVTPAAITSNGNPVSATKSPFIYEHGENGVLIEGTPGTSSYSGVDFDGSGDHLTVAQSSSQFSGQSDYTVECWVKFNSFVTDGALWSNWNSGNNRSILLECNSSNNGFKFMINSSGSGGWTYINNNSVTVTPNKDQWYHLCQTYDHSATTTKCYINGKFYGENTSTTPYNDSNANLHIGINQAASGTGTIDAQVTNFRWSSVVRYTEDFVPSRTPFTSDGDTVFLGCLDGSSVTTAVTNNAGAISAVGDPQVYTVSDLYGPSTKITIPHNAPDTLYYYCQSHSGMGGTIGVVTGKATDVDKYASHCVLALPFAGTHDDVCPQINPVSTAQYVSPSTDVVPTILNTSNLYGSQYQFANDDVVTIEDSPHLELAAKDFCIELWYYPSSLDSAETLLVKRANSGSYGGFLLQTSGSNITVSTSISGSSWDGFYSKTIGQVWSKKWHHIAVFRKGNDWYGAVDGVVKVIPANSSGNFIVLSDTNHWYLGGESNGGYGITGYMQDFRMYIGTSKYTSKDFIVPSLQPSVLSESPSGVSLASKFRETLLTTGSVWFNGTSDFLRIPASNDFDLSNNSFTMEGWFYFDKWEGTGFNTLVWVGSDATAANNCFVLDYKDQTDELRFVAAVSNSHSGNVYSAHCSLGLQRWYHLAWCRDGSKLRLFVDGIQVGNTFNITSTIDGDDVPLYFGKRPGNDDRYFAGNISNFRFVNGTALYTKDFKPSTKPLTNITNTKLLCCQSNKSAGAATVSPNITGSINTGTVWSDTTDPSLTHSEGVRGIFDGFLTTRGGAPSTNNNYAVLTDGCSISASTGIRIYWNGVGAGQRYIRINGSTELDDGSAQLTPGWSSVSSYSGTINKIEVKTASSGSWSLAAVEVDGTILTDPVTAEGNTSSFNSFDDAFGSSGIQETTYCTWNRLDRLSSNVDIQNAGLNWSCNNSDGGNCRATMHVSSGKWYWEIETQSATRFHCGVIRSRFKLPGGDLGNASHEWVYRTDGYKVHNNSESQISSNHSAVGNLIMIAYDADNQEIYFGGNGIWFGTSDPVRRISPAYTGMDPQGTMTPVIGRRTDSNAAYCNFGQKPFRYHPPEGFESLNYSNFSKNEKSKIVRPDQYFKTVAWTGDGGSGKDVEVGFEPDLVWVKGSNHNQNHLWHDNVRGLNNYLKCDETATQSTNNEFVKRTDHDGIRIGNSGVVNDNGEENVAWCWKAGGTNETTYNGAVKFDGSGDALTISDHADLEMASETNWTIEFWVKLNATPSADWRVIVGKGLSSGNNYEWFFECFTDNTLKFLASDDGTAWPINQSFTDTLTNGTWYHVAVVRNGTGANTLKGYLNGVQKWSITSLNLHTSGGGLGIGAHNDGGSITLESNTTVSNLRIVKGTSVYTSAFTPSTTPLAAISNTKLLCCKSGDSTVYDVSPGAISRSGHAYGDYGESPFTKKKFQVDGVGYTSASAAGLTAGDTTPTGCSIGTKQGFSIVRATLGTNSGTITIPHGLGKTPEFIIAKSLKNNTYNWDIYHKYATPSGQNRLIFTASQLDSNDPWGNVGPTSSVFTFNTAFYADASEDVIFYSWTDVPGYSKMGSYVGNWQTTEGPYIHLGFKPAYLLIKDINGANSWCIYDTVRDIHNPATTLLQAQSSTGNAQYGIIDFLATGFKVRAQVNALNANDSTYIFAAFAQSPAMNLYGSQSNAR